MQMTGQNIFISSPRGMGYHSFLALDRSSGIIKNIVPYVNTTPFWPWTAPVVLLKILFPM